MTDFVKAVGVRRRDEVGRRAQRHEIQREARERCYRCVFGTAILAPLRRDFAGNGHFSLYRHLGVRPRRAADDARQEDAA